jgi:hypothetical protein
MGYRAAHATDVGLLAFSVHSKPCSHPVSAKNEQSAARCLRSDSALFIICAMALTCLPHSPNLNQAMPSESTRSHRAAQAAVRVIATMAPSRTAFAAPLEMNLLPTARAG